MYVRHFHVPALTVFCVLVALGGAVSAQHPPPPAGKAPLNELDAFMEKVLARREVNRRTLEQYILEETEDFEVLGPGRWPLHRTKRHYAWYVRDGMHVRSPVKFNGVTVGEEARKRYEDQWIHREKSRLERAAKKEKSKPGEAAEAEERSAREVTVSPDGLEVSGTLVPSEPRFVSEAYFMDFKFEPGNYYLAGRERLEGQEVLRIEYYPTKMFGDADDNRRDGGPREERREQRSARDRKTEEDIERRMNKTALITLWIDPKEHQIVKYTFDNVWLDFLPAAWLVRVDDIRASMTMGQPFPGVWLPRGLSIHAGITLANGSYEASYGRTFSDYRLAEVETKIRIPKSVSTLEPTFSPPASALAPRAAFSPTQRDVAAEEFPPTAETDEGVAAFADGEYAQAQEVIGEIRIHGNAFLTDKEVLDLAGIAVGQPLGPAGTDAIAKRLEDSRRFETVEVRKRYRSLTDTADVALVLLVHEKPGVRSAVGGVGIPGVPGAISQPAGRLRSKLMFLPIVSFTDGYGFTYGGRMSTVDLLGIGERLSVPLTWGGTRRAALEFERQFKAGPLTRIESSFGIWNRENPRFEIRDQRVEVKGRAERVFADLLRVGVDASRSTISFADLDDRLWTLGTSVALDTRLDPAYPGNAVFLGASWSGLHFREVPGAINRYTGDARGYLRVFRQIVLAGRAQYTGADAALPPYERILLGGSSSLRGFRTGAFDGDRLFATSAELRVPITSVLSGAKLGMTAFFDAGRIWDAGQTFDSTEWHRGAGAGLFLIASIVKINVDVARGLKTGDTRVHLSGGFSF